MAYQESLWPFERGFYFRWGHPLTVEQHVWACTQMNTCCIVQYIVFRSLKDKSVSVKSSRMKDIQNFSDCIRSDLPPSQMLVMDITP